ncbi:hypothetical protein [Paraflavitalea speifideaquila]|uniref:hypothetical protein n=1 Tax=Paraflavitalea speifideaquila TaxID=3076558 RepID=UPI0028ED6949|nr:hypothetical protein [Paraflavitalea speifideiaquila]
MDANEKGFITSDKKDISRSPDMMWNYTGKVLIAIKSKAPAMITAGVDWVDPVIQTATQGAKYTYTSAEQAGPGWKYQ